MPVKDLEGGRLGAGGGGSKAPDGDLGEWADGRHGCGVRRLWMLLRRPLWWWIGFVLRHWDGFEISRFITRGE